ncbi:muscle M-line assembly protein unc-89-like [Condylostylus longicornis]|uniref:muscle M-line assembly protein unc-89-like n=1 Tax=Condylostylus longicornis TaxID=2530218 RepID=UPI00244E5114|nr:muscle M-line assembly protein unc-89-like [Condylostylus longicornis]
MAVIDTENAAEGQIPTEKDASSGNLKVPKPKKKKSKSPGKQERGSEEPAAENRAGSMTPAPRSSRSKTPLSNYFQRRSEDPSAPFKIRSITPFINRQSKEKTPFELGKDIRDQLIAHKMVFDRASYMDISDDANYEPARYITSDVAVVDRASVMDISNVEVVYMIEEYDDVDYDAQAQTDGLDETKKKKAKKSSRKSKSVSIAPSEKEGTEGSPSASVERESPKPKTKTIKKKVAKKGKDDDEEEERSPSPVQLPKLKLELGGGPKVNKKLFEQKPAPPTTGPEAKPPPKRAKPSVVQMEGQQKKGKEEAEKKDQESESRDGSEIKSDRELSVNPEDEDYLEDEEKEATPEPEPEPTEEELAAREAARLEMERLEEEKREWERKERARIKILRDQMAEIEKWNRIREEEGVTFMNRIKRFIAQKRNDPTNPCFVNHLPNATVMEGKNVRISCSVNGTDLEIKWYKNGREIHPDDKYIMSVNLYDILSLEILNCLKVDSGEYTCMIFNGNKRASSTCFVGVYDVSSWKDEPCPPNIDAVEDSYHCVNDELTIECRVHGTPRPVVTFYRDDVELKTNQIYTVAEKSHGVHALMIKSPTPRDTGIYVIKATNTRGEHIRKHIVEFLISTEKVVY